MGALIQIEANPSHPFHIQFEAEAGSLNVVLYNEKKNDKAIELTEATRFSIPCTSKADAEKWIMHIRWACKKAIDALNARSVELNAVLATPVPAAAPAEAPKLEAAKSEDQQLQEMIAAEEAQKQQEVA